MSFFEKILVATSLLIISILGLWLFPDYWLTVILCLGLLLFSVVYIFLNAKEKFTAFFEGKTAIKNIIYAILLSLGTIAVLWFIYIFGRILYGFNGTGTNSAIERDWLANADYLSAAATLIAACISLIPIFWLIRQNDNMSKQMEEDKKTAQQQEQLLREQMKADKDGLEKQLALQQAQNNADMFIRASELLAINSGEEKSPVRISCGLYVFSNLADVSGEYAFPIIGLLYPIVSSSKKVWSSSDYLGYKQDEINKAFDIFYQCVLKLSEISKRGGELIYEKQGDIKAEIAKWKLIADLTDDQRQRIAELEKLFP